MGQPFETLQLHRLINPAQHNTTHRMGFLFREVVKSTARGACDVPPCNSDSDVTLMCSGYFPLLQKHEHEEDAASPDKEGNRGEKNDTDVASSFVFGQNIKDRAKVSSFHIRLLGCLQQPACCLYRVLAQMNVSSVSSWCLLGFHWIGKRCALNASLLPSWRRTVQKTSPRHRSRRALIISYSTSLPQGNVGCS